MTFVLLLAMLSSYIDLTTSCVPTTLRNRTSIKRWYSITNIRPAQRSGKRGPWPLKIDPTTQEVTAPIRYCFEKATDYDTLNDYLQAGIKLWQPAMDVSLLRIVPENGIGGRDNHCDAPGASADALMISDTTDEEDHHVANNWAYVYDDNPEPGTMYLRFDRFLNPHSIGGETAFHVESMVHELGHAIGLLHEFSRPDRLQYLTFQCQNLKDYEDVREEIETAPQNQGDTIEKACTDFATAARYDFQAAQWLPNLQMASDQEIYYSKSFDPNSIMMYDWWNGAKGGTGATFPQDAVLIMNSAVQGPKAGDRRPTPGGNIDSSQRKISAGDIARVAQLYPDPKQAAGAGGAAEPSWTPAV